MKKKNYLKPGIVAAILSASLLMSQSIYAAEIASVDQKKTILQKEILQTKNTPIETPLTEPPQTEVPQTDPSQTEPPQTESPQTEPPQTEPPQTEPPQTEVPQTEAPQTDAPQTEVPQTEAPQTDAPQTQTSQTETSHTEKSETSWEENRQNEKPRNEQKDTVSSIPEYITENATGNNVKISGFHIDPSQYGTANISENTKVIYRFLVNELKLNHAAACGVLANIQHESNFNQNAVGDGGTSYGICQWHNGRFQSLMSYCQKNHLDYNTLEGQLFYLKEELENNYKGVLDYLLNVPDTEQGSYDAAYYWCAHFEIPNHTYERAAQRGNLAENEYYPKVFSYIENEDERIDILLDLVEFSDGKIYAQKNK